MSDQIEPTQALQGGDGGASGSIPGSSAVLGFDLTFANPGERYGTRAGWTATIKVISALRAEGYIDTDYCRHPCMWRIADGTAELPCDNLVEKLP